TIVGVYAWITKPTSGIDLNVRSLEIFNTSAEIRLDDTPITNNSDAFDEDHLTVEFTADEIDSYTTNGMMPLSVGIVVEAYKNIKVRIKIVEMWTNNASTEILERPAVFTWQYDTEYSSGIDNEGYFYYSEVILKDTSDVISFIRSEER